MAKISDFKYQLQKKVTLTCLIKNKIIIFLNVSTGQNFVVKQIIKNIVAQRNVRNRLQLYFKQKLCEKYVQFY